MAATRVAIATLLPRDAQNAGPQSLAGIALFTAASTLCAVALLCAAVPLREAFKVSSNQYFAELANFLGRERMGETARLLGMAQAFAEELDRRYARSGPVGSLS